MIICDLCGKKFKNAQGLRGHKTFVHGITGSKIPKAPAIQQAGEPQLSSLEERLARLELIAISKDSLPGIIAESIAPLSDKLINTTEQLARISNTVSILNQDIRRSDATITAQRKEFNQVLTNLQDSQDKIDSLIKEQRDTFSRNLATLESRIDRTQREMEITGDSEPLPRKLLNTIEQLAKLNGTVSILSADTKHNETASDVQKKEFSHLLANIQESHNRLATAINEHHYTFTRELEALGSRIDQTQKLVEIPGDPEPLTQKLSNTNEHVSKLSDVVNRLGQDVRRTEITTEAQVKELSNKINDAAEQLNKLNRRLDKQAFITGVKDSDDLNGDTESLTQKLINTNDQLVKLRDVFVSLNQDFRLGETGVHAQQKEFTRLLGNLQESDTHLSGIISEQRDTFNKSLLGLESRIDETQQKIEAKGDIEPLTVQLNNTTGQLAKLNDVVNKLSQDVRLNDTATDTQKKEFSNAITSTSAQLSILSARLDRLDFITGLKDSDASIGFEPLTLKLSNTAGQVNKLAGIIDKLEHITGLKDIGANGNPIDSPPLTVRLNNTTEQLNKIENIVSRLDQDVKLNETTTNAQRKEFSQLLTNLQEANNRITSVMNGRDDTFDRDIEVLESRVDETQKMIEAKGNIEPLTRQLDNTNEQLVKLGDVVNKLSQDVSQNNTASDALKKEFGNELNNTSAQLTRLITRLDKLDFVTGLTDSDTASTGFEPLTLKLSNTAGQVDKLTDIVGRLRFVTGLKESGLEDIEPLTQKLDNAGAQLVELAEAVDKLSRDIKQNNTASDAHKNEFSDKLSDTIAKIDKINDTVHGLSQDVSQSSSASDAQRKEFDDRLSSTAGQLAKFSEVLSKLEFTVGLSEDTEPLTKQLNNTTGELNKLNNRLDKFALVIGVNSGSADVTGEIEPITQQISNTTDQLNKLTGIVGKIGQDIKLNETATDAHKMEFSQLLTNLQEAHNRLATVINEHHFAFNRNLEVLESRIDKTQKMVELPGDSEPIAQKISNAIEQMNNLTDTVSKLNIGIDLNNTTAEGQRKELTARLNSTNEELMKIGGIVNKLTSITGLGDTASGETPGNAEPFSRKFSSITDQLNKLTKIVDILGQDISLYDAVTDGQRKEFNNRFNNTNNELTKINGTLNKLISVIGLEDSDSTEVPGDSEPLLQKVKDTSSQLVKISDLVSKQSQDISLNITASEAQKKEFGLLLANLQETDIRLTAIINEHRDAVNKNLEVLESRIDETQEMIEIPGDSESLPQKLVGVIEEMNRLANRLDKLDFLTGLRDFDANETQGNIEPLTKKLSNTTEQLAKIGDIVNKLNLDVRLIGHTTDAQRKEISNRITYTSEELVKISGMVSRFEVAIGLGDADLADTAAGSESLTKKLSKAADQLNKLSDTVNKLKFITGLKDSGPDDITENATPLTQKISNATEQLNELADMVGRLEFITGLKDSTPDGIPQGIEPLTQKLTDTTGQLNKLTEMVGRLSRDFRQIDTATDAQRKDLSNKISNTGELLNTLTGRLDKLDFITGLKESSPGNIPGNPEPLTKKLNNTTEQLKKLNEIVNKLSQDVSMSNVITDGQRKGFTNKLNGTNEQLAKLSDIVGKLSQDIKQNETTTDAQKKEFSQLLTNLQEAQAKLTAAIEEHHNVFNKDLELLESRLENTQKMVEIPGDPEPLAQKLSNINGQLATLVNTVGKIEYIIGLHDSDLAVIPGDTEPLTGKLNATAEQLNKLTEIVSQLSQNVRSKETTTDAQRNEFNDRLNDTKEQLVKINNIVGKLSEDIGQSNTATGSQKKEFHQSLTNLQESQIRLAAVIDEHRDTITKNMEGLESRIENTQKMVDGISEANKESKPKQTPDGLDSLGLIPQLKTGLENVDRQIGNLQAEVAKAQALAVRTPTDEFVTINMANGTRHPFRVYRGKRGLAKPHRIGIDPVYGEKYVDLAEPED